MSLRVRLRFTKSLLRRSELMSFAVGFCCLGLCATIMVHVWLFQAYQNWAFEQELGGEPVSISGFLTQAVAFSEPATLPPLVPSAAGLATPQAGFPAAGYQSVVGRIEIPRIGLKAIILEGATRRTLALAVGHIPGTPLPGGKGNAGLAAHRDTFFRGLSNIQLGDTIVVTTLEGSFEYRVESCRVVGPRDTRVLENSEEAVLTLVTCYPFHYLGPAPERFIVRATRAAG
ncbi:MAG: class D sortase [Acidobacteriia bacterium]|nr:class D sortase [Terriglobia bacterium]